MHRNVGVCLIAMVFAGCAEEPAPVWVPVSDDMAIAREGLSLSSTNEGVLVTGGNLGSEGIINFAEKFDPVTKKWTPLPDVRGIVTSCGEVQRQDHRATPMPDGRILITGGRFMMSESGTQGCACAHNELFCREEYSQTLIVYDPDEQRADRCREMSAPSDEKANCSSTSFDFWSDGWSPAFHLGKKHALHTVNLLSRDLDRVATLLIGGPGQTLSATAEIIEYRNNSVGCLRPPEVPDAEIVQAAGNQFITGHSATPIEEKNGRVARVLVFGGANVKTDANHANSVMADGVVTQEYAQIVTIGLDNKLTWALVPGTLPPARIGHITEKLASGKILIAGGWDQQKNALRDAWIFDGERFAPTGAMHEPHAFAASIVHGNEIIISGGFTAPDAPSKFVERYDAKAGTWHTLPAMKQPRARHAMLQLLDDGVRFLATGGIGSDENVVRTGEILFMNEGCSSQRGCSSGLLCNEDHRCAAP